MKAIDRAGGERDAAHQSRPQALAIGRAPGSDQRGDRLVCRHDGEQRILPADQRDESGNCTEHRPLRRRAALASRQPQPGESGDTSHRRRVRHARFLDQVPEHEGAAHGERGGGCRFPSRERQRGNPVGEPATEQSVDQSGDAHGLPVRIRHAIDADVGARCLQVLRHRMRGGKEWCPHDRRADRPRRLRVAGRRRIEQVGFVPEPEHLVIVGEVDVVVEGERPKVGVVVEAVALQPRGERELARHADDEEHREQGRHSGGTEDRDRHGGGDHGGRDQRTERAFDAAHVGQQRPPGDFTRAEFQRDQRQDHPGGDADALPRRCDQACQGRTL